MVTPRLRYTHKLTVYTNINSLFSGAVTASMTPSATQPDIPFKLELCISDCTDLTGLTITGNYEGVTVTEIVTINGNDTIYSENTFDEITSIAATSFDSGVSLDVNAVDEAYQPIFWEIASDSYQCTFSTIDGMSAGIQPESSGLRTTQTHYVRLPIDVPVKTNMEFGISLLGCPVGRYDPYTGKRYVPITDFDVICIPPKYLPVEWAFRCTEKTET